MDTEDQFPENITIATEGIPHMNLMPVYGLNVSSMLKHQTLVLTERAVKENIDHADLPSYLNTLNATLFKTAFICQKWGNCSMLFI